MPRNVKGTRDIVGQDALLRKKIVDTLARVFEKYGFQPFYTPVLESSEVLKTKVSNEILGLIYEFKDKAKRDIGLRYDLTIGLARYAASTQLSFPFKRYQIERAWRYESPQAGRYREFWQADIDILGVESAKADAECLTCISEALEAIGIKKFIIRVNSRKLLDEIADECKIGKERTKVYQVLDKLDKIGKKAVEQLLKEMIGVKAGKFLKIIFGRSKRITEEIKELRKYASMSKIDKKIKIDLTLTRGLAYYTGLIFEIATDSDLSIAGGGRYDDLVEKLGGRKTTATGISIGIDRVAEILKKDGMEKTITQVYIIPISEKEEKHAIRVLRNFRRGGINTDISLGNRSVGRNVEYANKTGIPYVVFVGKEEMKQGKIKVRDMESGREIIVSDNRFIMRIRLGRIKGFF